MLYQATAVAIGGRGLLITGPPGSGKTSLALALIDRGARLIGDDGVSLSLRDGVLWSGPAEATSGLIEVRGVGIVSTAACAAPVALILRADPAPPRFVEAVPVIELLGVPVPALPFDLGDRAAALRAEYALELHGLPRSGAD